MRFRKLGSSDLEVSEISLGSWLTFSGGVEFEHLRPIAAEAGLSLAAIDEALGDAPVRWAHPALQPEARQRQGKP